MNFKLDLEPSRKLVYFGEIEPGDYFLLMGDGLNDLYKAIFSVANSEAKYNALRISSQGVNQAFIEIDKSIRLVELTDITISTRDRG